MFTIYCRSDFLKLMRMPWKGGRCLALKKWVMVSPLTETGVLLKPFLLKNFLEKPNAGLGLGGLI
jgi:hypothetical protein